MFIRKATTNFPTLLPQIGYTFSFSSLLPLSSSFGLLKKLQFSNNQLPTRLLIKRSFILFLWVNYLKNQSTPTTKVRLSYVPTKKSLTTLARAPMAHKKTSKEQFKWTYLRFRLYVEEVGSKKTPRLTSAHARLFAGSLVNRLSPFSTNLIFTDSCVLKYLIVSDNQFYYKRK